MKLLTNLDLAKNELQNAVVQHLASAPSSPVAGQVYYDTSTTPGRFYGWNGTSWVLLDSQGNSGTVTSVALSAPSGELTVGGSPITGSGTLALAWASQTAYYVFARGGTDGTPSFQALVASHIPTLTAAKISDFDTQVRSSRLDQMAAPSGSVSMNSQKITSLADPTSAQDAATKGYVDATAAGIDWKASVKCATTANITLSGEQTIDGVTTSASRILVKNQSTASQNGIYVTAAGSWTRATDADATAEVSSGMAVFVEEGTTLGATGWILTTTGTITIGSTSLTFTQWAGTSLYTAGTAISISGNVISIPALNASQRASIGVTGKYSALIGDGSTTAIAVTQGTHGLASTAQIKAAVYDASTGDQVFPDVSINNSNGTVTLTFATAPSSNAYRLVLVG